MTANDIEAYKSELQQMVQQAERERLAREIKENTLTKVELDARLSKVEEKVDYIFNIMKGITNEQTKK